jgi:hypothetical protein
MEAITYRRPGKYIRVNAGKLNIALCWPGISPAPVRHDVAKSAIS